MYCRPEPEYHILIWDLYQNLLPNDDLRVGLLRFPAGPDELHGQTGCGW